MKKIFIILMSVTMFVCCSDDNDGADNSGAQEISLNTETIVLGMDGNVSSGSSNTVTVVSTSDWKLSGDVSWCTPSVTKGNNGTSVTFTASENNTGEYREVNLYFICGNAAAKLTVYQFPEEVVDYNNVSDSYSVDAAGKNLTFRVTTNLDVSNYETSEDWITFRPGIGTARERWIQFSIASHNSFYSRQGTITLFKGTDYEKTVAVEQNPYYGILTDDAITYERGITAGTIDVKVRGNVTFNPTVASTYSGWLSCQEISSTGTDIVEKTYRISYTATEYSRNGVVTITPSTGTSISISITQKNPNPELFEIPDAVFSARLVAWGYVLASGDKFELTYTGYNTTSISLSSSAYANIASIEGIEKFVNLTSFTLRYVNVRKVDLSKNTKLTTLTINYAPIEELILGDLPFTNLSISYLYNYYIVTNVAESFTISSSKVTSLTLSQTSYTNFEKLEYIDITACPAITSLTCNRSTGNLKYIYVTQTQKNAYDAGTLSITANANYPVTVVVK